MTHLSIGSDLIDELYLEKAYINLNRQYSYANLVDILASMRSAEYNTVDINKLLDENRILRNLAGQKNAIDIFVETTKSWIVSIGRAFNLQLYKVAPVLPAQKQDACEKKPALEKTALEKTASLTIPIKLQN